MQDSQPAVVAPVHRGVRRYAALFALPLCLLAACGRVPDEIGADTIVRGRDYGGYRLFKTAPDEHGVVCYSTERNTAALSCVKVR
jgi:hypothetical protein